MKETAEFKIFLSIDWQNTPVVCSREFEGRDLKSLTYAIKLHAGSLATLTGREVRWNWSGSPQGHYAQPYTGQPTATIHPLAAYGYGGFYYCADCAPVLDEVIVNDGEVITPADFPDRFIFCDECRCEVFGRDIEAELPAR